MALSLRMPFKIRGERFEIFIKEEDGDIYDMKLLSRKQLFSVLLRESK
jgi:hypothetical protein